MPADRKPDVLVAKDSIAFQYEGAYVVITKGTPIRADDPRLKGHESNFEPFRSQSDSRMVAMTAEPGVKRGEEV